MAKALYEKLGADESDDGETIKRHYRRRSKECHPDRHPDKAQEFKDVTEAFNVLIDPSRRAEYDRTGEVPPLENDPRRHAMAVLSEVLQAIIESDLRSMRKTSERQLIKDIKHTIDSAIAEIEKHLAQMRKSRDTIIDVADRITSEDADNVMARIARAPLRDLNAAIGKGEQKLAAHKEAWAIAKRHGFRTLKRKSSTTTTSSNGWETVSFLQ